MNDKNAFTTASKGQLLKNEPLANYTSWRTGGPADYVYIPADLEDLSHFLQQLPDTVPLTWLGLGSNTLIRDKGVDGVVIITQGVLNKLTQVSPTEIRVEAGVASAQLARHTARMGAAGLEFMAGIPGTVGGALAMNAGCFGGETWQFVQAVETINRRGEIKKRPLTDFEVTYRHVARPSDEWFVAGYFGLVPGDKEKSLANIRTLLERRNNTQPTGTANCGSVFRNPPGNYAGRLIEECGLKGKSLGGARISEKHANFIINENRASSADIENLIAEVGAIVLEKTGVRLIAEVCIIGRM
ncbi:UDP-N-acetylmuramate dehydrogenase [Aquicella lusitana]|uniref:UDP-N-acetylenolpyruvoylglucosamine reductase n=1 Tax=Aquicella lusitana TaxID=254246 RepID=A0A370GLZ8_9COXI|nr:UDP-N-acetylmuramate dehydrogenase [Aquicella lusitana]RDI44778.1 UDP-N-acetylmuramate dehydrogenase [Aquicella lusitana]VVC72975.1 UDP-N-acetylenolpyruvoylglucosamine reductase [Aquicella lusitana]